MARAVTEAMARWKAPAALQVRHAELVDNEIIGQFIDREFLDPKMSGF